MCPALSRLWPSDKEEHARCCPWTAACSANSPEGQAVGSAPGGATSLLGRGGMGCGIHVLIPSFLLPHSPNAELRAGKSCGKVKDESRGIAWNNTWQAVLAWPRPTAAQEELALMLSQSLGHGGCTSPTLPSTAPAKQHNQPARPQRTSQEGHCLLARLHGLPSCCAINSSTAVKSAQSALGTWICRSHSHRAMAQKWE